MPQLDPSSYTSQIFWLVITFVLLYGLIHYITVPIIQKLLQKRQDVIANNIKKAEDAKIAAELIETEYSKAVQDAHTLASRIIQEANDKIKRETDEKLSILDREIKERIIEAEAKMLKIKQEISMNISSQTLQLSSILIEKITGVKPDDNQLQLIINGLNK